ncbi:MAG: type II toxin-antitoxin system RelE/ParE family toxin [Azospirillaceae bacterium]
MRVFKTKAFDRFARRNGIGDLALSTAAVQVMEGSGWTDLGGGLIKQRIARQGQGKSAEFRTIVVFRRGDRAIFVHGFAEKDRANINRDELSALRLLARALLSMSAVEIDRALGNGTLLELTR